MNVLKALENKDITPEQAISAFNSQGPRHISQFEVGAPIEPLECGFPSIMGAQLIRQGQGDLIVLAARPGQGKSALAAQLALNVSSQGAALIYSFEMDPSVFHRRLLALESDRPIQNIHFPAYREEVEAAQERLNKRHLYLEYVPGMDVETLINSIREFNRKQRLVMVVIDYVQIIGGPFSMTKADRVEKAMTELKQAAENLGLPIILVSQMNRAIDSRLEQDPTAEPVLADLADSSSIEKWADVVMFLQRNEANYAKIHVIKNRHGESTQFGLRFSGAITKFFDTGAVNYESAGRPQV